MNGNVCFIGHSTIPLHHDAMPECPYLEINRERRFCDITTFSLGDIDCLGWPCLMEDELGF